MKKFFVSIVALFILLQSHSQILNPVQFNYSAVKKGSDLYELRIKAVLEPKWHIYSVKNPDGGALATELKLTHGKPVGAIKENGKVKTTFEKEFGVNQKYFENSVDFVQMVKLTNANKISGTLTYMVCNDRQCLPPKEVEFKIKM